MPKDRKSETYSRLRRSETFTNTFLALLNRVLHDVGVGHLKSKNAPPPLAIFAFDNISQSINVSGRYESEELKLFSHYLQASKSNFQSFNAIDVGANIGNHALFFSAFFKTIICYEPNPRTFEILKFNSRFAQNLELHNLGISDEAGEFEMYSFPHNIGGATVLLTGNMPPSGAQIQNVRLEKLDNIKTLNNIGLIKIDVEGLELRVILGAENLIKRDKPIILFESIISGSEHGESDVVDLLKRFGYKDFLAFQKWPNSRLKNRNLRFAVNFILRMLLRETHLISPITNFNQNLSFVIALPGSVT